jgi:Anti-sigma-K factor rskA, C-terminal
LSPDFDELVGTETTGTERKRLREAHDLLLRAGPPPELTPKLKAGPNPGVARMQHRRRAVKRRSLALLAAALSIAVVFAAGYAVSSHRSGKSAAPPEIVKTLQLKGTAAVPDAQGTLAVWQRRDGNWPMTLNVTGLPKLPPRTYYEVYLFRDGHPWASCGSFVVSGTSSVLRVSLNAPYKLHPGDSWVVTRQTVGSEPGRTVLRPVSA